MKKLILPSDWLLIVLAKAVDFIQEIKNPLHLMENYYLTYYGYIPARFKKANLYHLLWRNLRTGNIKKKVIEGKVYFELTSVGKDKIVRKYPLLNLQNKRWDGKWRIVIFDIEEENKRVRDLFRRKLKELGFGGFQKSVWISPHDFLKDFKEFLENYNLQDKVVLIETKNFYVGDIKKLAVRLWHLDDINNLYRALYDNLLQIKSLKKLRDRVKLLNSLREEIIYVYLKDPYLPKDFLPDDWLGDEVKVLIKKMKIFC